MHPVVLILQCKLFFCFALLSECSDGVLSVTVMYVGVHCFESCLNGCFKIFFLEPDYDFEKPLTDADAYEKETAEFECEVNDEEAPVQWYREDKVCCNRTELLEFVWSIWLMLLLTLCASKISNLSLTICNLFEM